MHDALSDAPADDPPWLAGLNPPQREAVETLDGPLLVLSGAGTGKTRVLTARLALLLAAKRAWPSQILAVTFTNRAANEMRERVDALIGEMSAGLWLGTFHALGLRILRRHPELVGLRPSFSILDPDDQERLLKQVLADANVDAKHWPARQLSAIVQRWKDKGWRPEQVPADEAGNFANGRAPALYEAYQERLEQLNAVDFGDLLLHNLTIFQRDAGVLAQYQERFRYILVDEYQDTNVAQYLWLRLLAQKHRNICCVGDDDQSIYAWRGAEVGNILRFENDFDGARIVRLEQNYRSTGDILGAASGLIANNRGRLGKTLWTTREDSRPITVHTVPDGEAEARLVGAEIEALQRAGTGLGRMAVLMRASFQMRAFEERFVALGLNYRVIGGPRFYERREVRDAIAYLRAVLFPEDDLAFERIVNLPKRGIGGATLQPVHRLARAERIPLGEAARRLVETEDLKARARNALAGFCRAIDGWRARLDSEPHADLADAILEESGYREMWRKDKGLDGPGRLENLGELVQQIARFNTLEEFLEHVSLVMEAEGGSEADSVSLMTLHGAKGLEFDIVFLPGWEEGLFPHQRALGENGLAGLEEERRLAYVGITRARRHVTISSAMSRMVMGRWLSPLPSRFIDELPDEHVERQTENAFGEAPAWRYGAGGGRVIDASAWEVKPRAPRTGQFEVGQRVFHQKFGYGAVRAIDREKLTVAFETSGDKTLIDSFVEPA